MSSSLFVKAVAGGAAVAIAFYALQRRRAAISLVPDQHHDPVPLECSFPPSADFSVAFVAAGELTFEVIQAGNPAAPKGLALCLHGFPESAYSYRHQLPLLASLGYCVWAPNLRGYGRTAPRPHAVGAYKIDSLLADVAALIKASGCKKVTLIAHDWGGIIAWMYALRQVGPLEGLVVMNIPHPTLLHRRLTVKSAEGSAQQKRSWYFRFFRLPWLPERALSMGRGRTSATSFREHGRHAESWPEEALDVLAAGMRTPLDARAKLNWYRANPLPETLAGPWPSHLDVPTLMIWGEHDRAFDVSLTEGTHELVRDITLRTLDASHSVQQDAPVEVNRILREWLGRSAAAS